MYRHILLSFLSFHLFTFYQEIKSTDIVGKWTLTRHTITIKGKAIDKTPDKISTYIFLLNGTYKLTDKVDNEIVESKGKWKLINKGGMVRLYNNVDIPDDPKVEIADHDLGIQFRNGKYYLIWSEWDVVDAPHKDYYEKSK